MSVRLHDDAPHALTWVVREPMARASHALVDDGRVWLVDPVADDEALERAAALGEPVGVLQLLDRHNRDAAAVARRFGVPLVRLPGVLGGTPFEVLPVVDRRWWREVALWWPERRLLLVPEALGTVPYFTLGQGPVGVHPALRATPPTLLRGFAPERLLVGHGGPVGEDAAGAVVRALAHPRRDVLAGLRRLPGLLRR
ncbi:hypothetical protein [Patulibacter sp. SYSU D01012]|uniref:hypothetical protein n=1 Tax=Patulibacter sp. SYSU D01012 TaxID=2817381 RepID=UPI001B305942|nr:hypothetical protein [Patulibacter sp. SYSU D01012]